MWISRHHRNVITLEMKKVDFFPHRDLRGKISMSEHEIDATINYFLRSPFWAAIPAYSWRLPRLHAK
jgi:hypothetical protein